MSKKKDKQQGQLLKVVFFPAVIIGVLILGGLLAISYAGKGNHDTTSTSHSDQPADNSAAQVFNGKYDSLGITAGKANAPVTIREFGDYQCPACGRFEPIAKRIRKEYVSTGQVRFIFFDFPLKMHKNSQPAAIAARCAALQNKFWPYHERMYQTQASWSEKDNPTSYFLDIGLESGLDLDKLKTCMANKTPLPTIKKERKAGIAIKLRATPTVLVNKTKFVGGPSYKQMKKAIEEALSNSQSGSGS